MKKFLLILGVSSFGIVVADDMKVATQQGSDFDSLCELTTKGYAQRNEKKSRSSLLVKRQPLVEKEKRHADKSSSVSGHCNIVRALDLTEQRESLLKRKIHRSYATEGFSMEAYVRFYIAKPANMNCLVPRQNLYLFSEPIKEKSVLNERDEEVSLPTVDFIMKCCCCSLYQTLFGGFLEQNLKKKGCPSEQR